ncbi:MAG: hypothetical protein D6758_11890 [Gammaproteobacteria bacterium]|nr:MAG: hypothetical protein D6758_11890 [Gammaproteobacteria bacterium]
MFKKHLGRGLGSAFFLGLALQSSAVTASESRSHWWFSLDSMHYSEPQPVYDAVTNWGESFDSRGTRQWTYNRFETGWHNGHWGIALLQRLDYRVDMSRDGVEFWGKIERREALEPGRRYQVTAEASGHTGTGIKLVRLFSHSRWGEGSAGLAVWRVNRVLDGELNGWALATSASEYDYQADVDYFYTEDPLFARPDLDRATGWGYGLDLHWRMSRALWRYSVDVNDLLGRIHWRHVPYTQATSTSARKEYDANGYLLLNPAISGFEGYKDATQVLDAKVHAAIERTIAGTPFSVVGGTAWLGQKLWGSVGAGFRQGAGARWEASIWPQMRRIDLGYRAQDWQLILGLDRLNVQRSRAVELSFVWGAGLHTR